MSRIRDGKKSVILDEHPRSFFRELRNSFSGSKRTKPNHLPKDLTLCKGVNTWRLHINPGLGTHQQYLMEKDVLFFCLAVSVRVQPLHLHSSLHPLAHPCKSLSKLLRICYFILLVREWCVCTKVTIYLIACVYDSAVLCCGAYFAMTLIGNDFYRYGSKP
jgi:hypothetical protein